VQASWILRADIRVDNCWATPPSIRAGLRALDRPEFGTKVEQAMQPFTPFCDYTSAGNGFTFTATSINFAVNPIDFVSWIATERREMNIDIVKHSTNNNNHFLLRLVSILQ
jgi:hypothetical protein